MCDSVPSARYSSVCNVLRQWRTLLIPTYRVYRLYDIWVNLKTNFECTEPYSKQPLQRFDPEGSSSGKHTITKQTEQQNEHCQFIYKMYIVYELILCIFEAAKAQPT